MPQVSSVLGEGLDVDVGGCGWMWMDVGGCGWMWMDVDVDVDT
jgi:hypothetical protein